MSSRKLSVSIVIPNFNGKDLLAKHLPGVIKACDGAEIIVVDDDSPDKTGEVSEGLSKKYNVKTIVRKGERGLATAVLAGFMASQARVCLLMDADGSHPVEKLPDMIKPILDKNVEATVGTRYIEGGDTSDWPFYRKFISKTAGLITIG